MGPAEEELMELPDGTATLYVGGEETGGEYVAMAAV
jgi:hypothetical protein